ncbi:hypothetical protein VNO78_27907 [Psophocarpus tetragonolobus]|uniref:BZIP domain-containing protein n=1 Tax=Psophocarpus tetragonolobus TaxID=3891 RepID=A0AAN9S1A6_PSOTE
MDKREMGGNRKEKMGLAKPTWSPVSSFQALQNTLYSDASGSSSSLAQASYEKNKLEYHPAINAVSGFSFVDSTSGLARQFQVAKPDMRPSLEQNKLDPKRLKRIMSNRLSAKRSRLKNMRFKTDLEIEAKNFEDQIVELQSEEASLQEQKQNLTEKQQTLDKEMEELKKEILLIDAEIEKNKAEVNGLRELQVKKQEQFKSRLNYSNIGLLEPRSKDRISDQGLRLHSRCTFACKILAKLHLCHCASLITNSPYDGIHLCFRHSLQFQQSSIFTIAFDCDNLCFHHSFRTLDHSHKDSEEVATTINKEILLSHDVGLPHEQEGSRIGGFDSLEEVAQQDRVLLHTPNKTYPKGSSAWNLTQVAEGGARALHGLCP